MNTKTSLIAFALTLLVLNLGITCWQATLTTKVAYVRSTDLVYGYFGMKEAMSTFQADQQAMKSELDTLNADLQHAIVLAKQFAAQKDVVEATRLEQEVLRKRNYLRQHAGTIDERAKEEEQRILSGVLAQINAFVETYALENGYDIILGTTADGSLLYAENGMDITDEVLFALNEQHEGL
jgi:outer membrane protein